MTPSILASSPAQSGPTTSTSGPPSQASNTSTASSNLNGIGSSLFGRSFFGSGSSSSNSANTNNTSGSNGIGIGNSNGNGNNQNAMSGNHNNLNPHLQSNSYANSASGNNNANNFMMGGNPNAQNSMNNAPPGAGGGTAMGWGSNSVLPNVGEQMDMNVLWDLVNQLSEVNQGIREQTQGVLHRVQMIQTRINENGGVGDGMMNGAGGEVNGPSHAPLPSQESPPPTQGQLPTLTQEDSQALLSTRGAIWSLLTDHENALSGLVNKLRPFVQSHNEALHAQRAHYTSLLDAERIANQELRMEIAGLREGMGRALGMARKAQEAQNEQSTPWRRRVAALKAENRVLRGITGLPEMEVESEEGESSSGEEDEDLSGELARMQLAHVQGGNGNGNGKKMGMMGGFGETK